MSSTLTTPDDFKPCIEDNEIYVCLVGFETKWIVMVYREGDYVLEHHDCYDVCYDMYMKIGNGISINQLKDMGFKDCYYET